MRLINKNDHWYGDINKISDEHSPVYIIVGRNLFCAMEYNYLILLHNTLYEKVEIPQNKYE